MIARYSRPEMTALWSEQTQYDTWLKVEILACEAWATLGKIPAADLDEIRRKSAFTIDSIHRKEAITKHDVAAFVSDVQEAVGPAGRFVHLGLTSSDVVDTAFSYRLVQSCDLIVRELDRALDVAKARAVRDKRVPMIGRTHGIHAEPTTMGLKWLLWYDALRRAKRRLIAAREEIAVGKLSGAVGNYGNIPPAIEKYVCEKLGLRVDTLSTQVIARDRHAAYFAALGLLGSAVEMIAVEMRHLQRTEVGEAREGFTAGQKGSSAMPHKRNPISAENLTGLARLLRGMVIPAMENCALWHERDISHSSVERVIGPDANTLADYLLARLTRLMEGLEIFPERMQQNLDLLHGVIYSQALLLALVEKGWTRDEAYATVQKYALQALDEKRSFRDLLTKDAKVAEILSPKEISVLFDASRYVSELDYLYAKVLS